MSMTRPKFPLAQMRYHATYLVKACAACKNLTWNLVETESLTLYYDSVEKLGLLAYFQSISFFLRPQSRHFRIESQRSLYSLFLTRANSKSNKSLKALVNEDTLLPMMFLGLPKLRNICCGHKIFLNEIRNIFHVYLRHLSTECRSILSADIATDTRPIYRPTLGRYVGRDSVACRST